MAPLTRLKQRITFEQRAEDMNYSRGILTDKGSELHEKQSYPLEGLPGCTAKIIPRCPPAQHPGHVILPTPKSIMLGVILAALPGQDVFAKLPKVSDGDPREMKPQGPSGPKLPAQRVQCDILQQGQGCSSTKARSHFLQLPLLQPLSCSPLV